MRLKRSQGFGRWVVPIAALFLLAGATIDCAVVLAQTGSVVSSPLPSDATPSVGDQIEVTISIDLSGVNPPHNALGSFTGSLAWNPAVLAYRGDSGSWPVSSV